LRSEELDTFVGSDALSTVTICQSAGETPNPRYRTFNVLRGSEYFFLPSRSALRRLGEER
jgi:hypothetical protein